jgi:sugar/nucleoside kinase (ribokinase family)
MGLSALDQLLRKTDVFLPNGIECQQIARSSNLHKALEYLQDIAGCVVVKLGDKGALIRTESDVHRTDVLKIELCDTVGAGDSFDVGFIYGYFVG